MSNELQHVSVQHGGGIASAVLGSTLTKVINGEVIVQVPVFASGRVSHIYLSADEMNEFTESAFVTELVACLDRLSDMAEEMYENKKEAAHE